MRLLLIGCEILLRELCDAAARSPHVADLRFLPRGLHDGGAKTLRAALQKAIDVAEGQGYERIAVGYGLCGNGLAGLRARSIPLIVPRAHDCITLLLGDRERFAAYFRDHPGTYFRSVGWVERGAGLEPLARARTGAAVSLDVLVEKYGEDNGRYLYEELTRYQRAYRQLTFIRTGAEPDGAAEASARAEAVDKGWQFEAVDGSLTLFRRLLGGDWDDRDFLEVPPGQAIVAAHDGRVIAAEEVAS